jgi:hypothetical protein
LKRAIERFLVYPLSNLVATQQVETGDLVLVDYDEENDRLTFAKQSGGMIVNDSDNYQPEEELDSKSDAVGLPLPQAQIAAGMSKSKGENNEV